MLYVHVVCVKCLARIAPNKLKRKTNKTPPSVVITCFSVRQKIFDIDTCGFNHVFFTEWVLWKTKLNMLIIIKLLLLFGYSRNYRSQGWIKFRFSYRSDKQPPRFFQFVPQYVVLIAAYISTVCKPSLCFFCRTNRMINKSK